MRALRHLQFWPSQRRSVATLLALFGLGLAAAQGRTFHIKNTQDTTDAKSLRGAILAANAHGKQSTIFLAEGVYQLYIPGAREDTGYTGDLDVTRGNLTIIGVGSNVTIDATYLRDRVIHIHPAAQVTMVNLTITGGACVTGTNGNGENGGGILNAGALTMDICTIRNNSAGNGRSFDGIYELAINGGGGGSGGGIYSIGQLTLTACTISGNRSGMAGIGGSITNLSVPGYTNYSGGRGGSGGHGGGVFALSSLKLNSCTISGNLCGDGARGGTNVTLYTTNDGRAIQSSGGSSGNGGSGGGIYSSGALELAACTVTENATGYGPTNAIPVTIPGGRIITVGSGTNGSGGGVFNAAGWSAALRNSLVALNSAGTNVIVTLPGGRDVIGIPLGRDLLGDFSSLGHNLIGHVDNAITNRAPDGSIGYTNPVTGFTNGVNGDIVGTFDSPIDPLLGPLQDNGGPTFTHALLPGSPAIDAGKSFGETADQRGFARLIDFPDVPNAPGGDGTDIGAFELSPQ